MRQALQLNHDDGRWKLGRFKKKELVSREEEEITLNYTVERRMGCKMRGSLSFRKGNSGGQKSEQSLTWKRWNERKELTVKKTLQSLWVVCLFV